MAEPHVLTGLIAKRAELAGKIEHTQNHLRQLVIDLDHIDAAIHIFDPSIELEEIKNKPVPAPHHAFRGQVTRITTLRNAKKPLTTQDIAQTVMAERGAAAQDHDETGGGVPAGPAEAGRSVSSAGTWAVHVMGGSALAVFGLGLRKKVPQATNDG